MTATTARHRWTAADIPDQSGRTIIVTGANSGLGLVTARELARHGAQVIMAVRNQDRGERARKAIATEIPAAKLDLRQLDLADLDSVRAFAATIATAGQPIDVLINNAGVMMPPRTLTAQGFELQFGANHLAHFALTGLLLPSLRTSQSARVVTVSSGLHRRGSINFDDLTAEQRYSPAGAYAQSKFANVLFGLELDRRARAAGLPIASLIAHPGYAATNLQTTGPTGLLSLFGRVGNVILAQSAEAGARSQLYAATDAQAHSGQFIGPDRLAEQRGHPRVVQPTPTATDPALARRLWDLSEELTGVHYGLPPAGA